ncbi:MAG: hypothetical protein ACI9SP_001395 [Arenicella sp.]|jgi:hypothetical protein
MTDQNQLSGSSKKAQFWNRVQIILVFVVFAAPVVGAFVYKPSSFNNYGDLYRPARPVANLQMQSKDGLVELDTFRRQWVLLVTANGQCSQACEANILKIRQLRFMQNNNMTRIRTVFLHTGLNESVASDLDAKYSPIETYRVDKDSFLSWTQVLKLDDAPIEAEVDRFYVIDPAGNLMMSYPASAEPSAIQKDIKRLLKTSQIG